MIKVPWCLVECNYKWVKSLGQDTSHFKKGKDGKMYNSKCPRCRLKLNGGKNV